MRLPVKLALGCNDVALTPTLDSIEALYRKLERELYRSYHERDRIHKADHFYNFCITAHAMRDYFFERKGIVSYAQKQPYNKRWKQNELLVAVADIANSAKHYTLRDRKTQKPNVPKTKKLTEKKSKFVDVYVTDTDDILRLEVNAPDCIVTLENGRKYDLYNFTKGVNDYWMTFLKSESIAVRRQSIRRLRGEAT